MDYDQPSPSYYNILGVDKNSSISQIRRTYKKLAMQWHPDRWTRTPSLLGEAKRKFQQIQEAYSVLSDQRKRAMYDAGLYDPLEETEEDEGFSDFLQEMLSLMENVRKEEKECSMEELQRMLVEMSKGLDSPQWFCGPSSSLDDYGSNPKRGRWEANPTVESNSCFHHSSLQMFGNTSFCT